MGRVGLAGEAEPAAADADPLGPMLEIFAEEVEEIDQQLAQDGGGDSLALGGSGPAHLGRGGGGRGVLIIICGMGRRRQGKGKKGRRRRESEVLPTQRPIYKYINIYTYTQGFYPSRSDQCGG